MPEGSLTSPEGLLMLVVAGILDLVGLILLFLSWLGVDDYGILDVIGLIIIGGWMLFRYGEIRATKGAQKIAKKMAKRLGLAFFGELIPFFGSAAPCWILAVFFELRSKAPAEEEAPAKEGARAEGAPLEEGAPSSKKSSPVESK